ncbi:methylosome subunit pICln [Elysia marginata]|uniref:Methylosome subunit pICln n=1 Tax=Elysia marginata TaxID=1093978 RepID=A0AAV4IJR0_9GAST|nr:methylosome subunit pICln [Elysia marginata]
MDGDSTGDGQEEDGDDDSESSLTEIRFAPDNKESLDAMFKALAMCQTLHPDSDCQLSDEADFEDADEECDEMAGGDVIYNSEEGFQHLTEEGRATMERLNQMLLANQQQRQPEAGDGDIVDRTDRMHLTNGNHSNGDAPMDADQFVDADEDGNNAR